MGRFLFLFLIVFNSMIIGKTILLDFEDRTLDETLNIQYQSKYGITFDGGVKVVDKSANLDKIPSGSNAIRLEKNNFFDINVPKGFSGALSFYYTSATHKGTVSIQDTKGGKTIAIRDLPSVGSKKYNDWKLVIIKFSKTAKFIRFYAQDNRIAFDSAGRPLQGDQASMTSPYGNARLITTDCNVTISDGTNNLVIVIRPETGYASIVQYQ